MLEGLSRFLVEHEPHGEGFDVAHPAGVGSGRVSITCRGCGARHDYATATLEIERELIIEPVEPTASQPNGGSRTSVAGVGRPKEPEPAKQEPVRRPARKRPSRLVTAGLLVLAAAALAFAVVRLVDGSGGKTSSTPAKPKPSPAAATNPTRPAAPNGERVRDAIPISTPAFALRAPRGWVRDTSRGGLLIHPPGRRSPSIQVFFQRRPELSIGAVASRTAAFLRSRGAKPNAAAKRLRVRGDPAFRITARAANRTVTATGIRHGKTMFLLVSSRGRAQGPGAREAAAVERSFRPR